MRNWIVTLLLLASCLIADASERRRILTTRSSPASIVYLIDEGFEEVDSGGAFGSGTDGYDSPLFSAETGGPLDNDYTTSPAPLVGSRSLFLDALTGPATRNARWVLSSGITSAEGCLIIYDATLPSNSTQPIVALATSGASDQMTMYLRSDGTLQIFNGSTSATTVSTVPASTKTWIFYRWSTDGTAAVEFSTTGTRTGTGNAFASVTGGSGTSAIVRLNISAVTGTGMQMIVDRVLLADGSIPIPSNP